MIAWTLLAAPVARAAAPVPLILDTDVFSDADDVGAMATAFGLQMDGEAKVIAINVNKPTSRGAVAADSWRCVAAITNFYGSGSIPIGSAMPDDGLSVGDAGFIQPCGALAPASTPAPQPAVNVYRQALATADDGSVVIVSHGFLGNLSALLDSPGGSALIARKVKMLVVMGGGYPSFADETNVEGDPVSAEDVAAHWPTKIVWSGYEVGAKVLTGHTISRTQPVGSPVRTAYEAFIAGNPPIGPDIQSWDLTAVYHAVRASDPLLTESEPGINAIDTVNPLAPNTFTPDPAADQRYLTLADADVPALEASLETLLDTLTRPAAPAAPSGSAPTASPPPASHVPAQAPPRAGSPPVAAPPARTTRCVVPTLEDRTLAGARRLLRDHHCALGHVSGGRAKGRLRVVAQRPARRTRHRAGARVQITLRPVA